MLFIASLFLALVQPSTANCADAPTFHRPFNGSPTPMENRFKRIVPADRIDLTGDCRRALEVGGCPPTARSANLPARFTDLAGLTSATGMRVGEAYFGQFVAHDQGWIRDAPDRWLVIPFVFAAGIDEFGDFHNRRTAALDLDTVYDLGPFAGVGQAKAEAWYDAAQLRFRFGVNKSGGEGFRRNNMGRALIGDHRNDENGITGQIHRAFQKLHNTIVDHVIQRDQIDEAALEPGSETWWAIYNEARNFTLAYYQGLVAGELARQLTGRTLWEAAADTTHPVGPLALPNTPLEFNGALFRQHTLIPAIIETTSGPVSPIDPVLRNGASWMKLMGRYAKPASRLDLGHPASLRSIVNLVIPGTPVVITLDIAQVSVLRGREMELPSGEEYLAFLLDELRLNSATTTHVRGKQVLTLENAKTFLDPAADAALLADLARGDTDLYVYLLLEAELNGGVFGVVGQDILERSWLGLLRADAYSMFGSGASTYTPEQVEVFRSATWEGLLSRIHRAGDLSWDGRIDALDLAMLLSQWGESGTAADLDGDGTVGTRDLTLLLAAWGE